MDSQVMTVSARVLKTVSTSLTKELSPYNFKDFAEKLVRNSAFVDCKYFD